MPRASRPGVGGSRDGALLVRVSAAPVEGAANEAVVRAVAAALGLAPSQVLLERGQRGRRKVLSVASVHRERISALAG